MKNYEQILLEKSSTIRKALLTIDNGAMKIALVIDKNKKLIGTLSDGDIRRGLLDGLELNDTIETIIFKTPIVCSINDSNEEVIELAFSKKIYQIPIVDEGILVGMHNVDELLVPKGQNNKVVLMVGGLGTRLRPLTDDIPKPMLEVGGKPILETIILGFKKYGFTNIILSVSYKAEVIESYFKDGTNFGVNIEYIYEDIRMGTAGALSLIRDRLNEPFFVMNGDLLTTINFDKMMQHHITKNSIATMGVREYDFQVPYGVVSIENESIVKIEEKPVQKFFVSAGVYILDNKVLEYIPNNTFYDMPTLFEKLIELRLKSLSFPIREYWLDIGRLEEFKRANEEYGKAFGV